MVSVLAAWQLVAYKKQHSDSALKALTLLSS